MWRRARAWRAAHAPAPECAGEWGETSLDGPIWRALRRSTAHAFARDDGKRVAGQLTGAALPSIELDTLRGANVDLRELALNWLVVYCYPGVRHPDDQESRIEDGREHRSYRRHQEILRRRKVRVAALSSQPRDAQVKERLAHEIDHTMLLDPALVVADWLGLPTLTSGDGRCYSRVTLLAREGMIEHVFCPVECGASNPSQILAWIDVHGC